MKVSIIRKWYIYIPIWLIIYALPFPVLSMLVIWGLSQSQPNWLRLIVAFPGTFLFGLIVLFPLFCIYYAVIALIHTLIDEIFFCETHNMQRFIICVLSTASSAILIISSICVYLLLFAEVLWIFWVPVVLMLLGCLIVFTLLGSRLIIEGALALAASIKQRRTACD